MSSKGRSDDHFLVSKLTGEKLTRRQLIKRSALVGLSVPTFASLLAACEADDDVVDDPIDDDPAAVTEDDVDDAEDPDDDDDDDDVEGPGEGTYGGEFRFALNGELSTFDLHQTSNTQVTICVMHMYEALFTWDEEFGILNELAESVDTSEDGLHNTIHLREGVLFHNGDELTSEDVVACIDRWANTLEVGFGQQLMAATADWGATDDYTIEFEMSESFGTFQSVLARQNNGCAIYPAEIVEAAGASDVDEYIGTGPYQFVERVPDQHIILERFEDYVYRDEEPDGYGGRKHAYFDTLRFIPVPDEAARIAGMQAGEYDQLEGLSPEQFITLEDDPNVVAELGDPVRNNQVQFNMVEGLMTDVNMRKAMQALMDMDEILAAAHGTDYSRTDPSHMMQETVWHTTAGEEYYNMKDPDLAQEYLEEAGYDGEPIRILTDQETMAHYHTAVVLAEQMEDVGMNPDIQVFDWATKGEMTGDHSAWEVDITGFTFRSDPTQLPLARTDWGGQWDSENRNEAFDRLFGEIEFEDRYAAWEDAQRILYEEDVPMCKTGEGFALLVYAPRVQNVRLYHVGGPAFWNQWFDE
jgi:peptide/nickel transport system substrate-binding protein